MNGGIVVKHIYDDEHFAASDGCMLAETMHPAREALPFGGYSIAHGYVEPHGRIAAHVLKNSASCSPASELCTPEARPCRCARAYAQPSRAARSSTSSTKAAKGWNFCASSRRRGTRMTKR